MSYEIEITVQVSIPVSLIFDAKPTLAEMRKAAIENFLDHPAIKPGADGERDHDVELYLDYVGNLADKLDLTHVCEACDGKGWVLADDRIYRCESCEVFDTDAAAVRYVAEKAAGGVR
jgi:hypothetical protein